MFLSNNLGYTSYLKLRALNIINRNSSFMLFSKETGFWILYTIYLLKEKKCNAHFSGNKILCFSGYLKICILFFHFFVCFWDNISEKNITKCDRKESYGFHLFIVMKIIHFKCNISALKKLEICEICLWNLKGKTKVLRKQERGSTSKIISNESEWKCNYMVKNG